MPQLDLVAEEPPDAVFHPRQQVVELHDLGMEHLPAAEGQELAGECGAPLAHLLDLPQVLAGSVVAGETGERQLGLAGDGGEQVVEHVGDAAREPAHGVHALRDGGQILAAAQQPAGLRQAGSVLGLLGAQVSPPP